MNDPTEIMRAAQAKPARLKMPNKKEILASSSLVIGEDTDAYVKLMEDLWSTIEPDDGFEAAMVRQMAHNQWRARRLARLGTYRLKSVVTEALSDELAGSEYIRKHGKGGGRKESADMLIYGGRGYATARTARLVKHALTQSGLDTDIGLMIVLDDEESQAVTKTEDLEELINKAYELVNRAAQRLMDHRKRKAKLRKLADHG